MQVPAAGQVDIWLAGAEYGPHEAALLSPEEQARVDRFIVDQARLTYLRGHILLRRALAAYTSQPPERLTFTTGPLGRPELEAEGSLRFSLSHTDGFAAVAVATDAIGVDVEAVTREIGELARVAELYFAPSERDAACSGAFFDLWTLKEACLKALGLGLSVPLHSVAFDISGEEPRVIFDASLGEDAAQWSFALLSPSRGYRLALALRHPRLSIRKMLTLPA